MKSKTTINISNDVVVSYRCERSSVARQVMPPFVNRRTDARKIELMSSNVGLCEREKTKQQTDIRLFFFFQQLVLFRFDSILLVRFRCKPRPRAAVVASGIERRGGRHIAIVDEQFDVNAICRHREWKVSEILTSHSLVIAPSGPIRHQALPHCVVVSNRRGAFFVKLQNKTRLVEKYH